jgi:CRP-like cAMP-binding protein
MPTDVEVMSLIRMLKTRLFEGLSSLEVASIIALATDRPFPKRSVMAHEGYPAKYLFLMIRGRARGFTMTSQGEKIPVLWFPPGKFLAERRSCPSPPNIL